MFYVIFYKAYKECPKATFISGFASVAIFLGIISLPLFILAMRDSSWLYGNYYIGILPATFFALGIYGKIKAPKYAHKDMVNRIKENLEYGRYIADKYPQHTLLVKELQPTYEENDSRPITDFLKEDSLEQAMKIRKRAPFLITFLVVLLIILNYINK